MRRVVICLAMGVGVGCNVAPGAPGVRIVPESPLTSDPLRAELTKPAKDDDGDAVRYRIVWRRDGQEVEGLTGLEVAAERTARGEVWEVSVAAGDGEEWGAAATASVTVQNTVPVVAATITPGDADGADELSCETETADADGDPVTVEVRWLVDGEERATGPVLPPDQTARGQTVVCRATPSDGLEAGEPVDSSPLVVGNQAPLIEDLAIDPDPARVDQRLVAVVESVDADGDAVTLSHVWTVDGVVVSEADALEAAPEEGAVVRLEVTPSDDQGAGEPASVELTVGNTPPVAETLTVTPQPATTADILTAELEASDVDGDALSPVFSWTVNGVDAGTGATLDGATAFGKHDVVEVTAWARDEADDSTPLRRTVTIDNTPPSLADLALSPAAPRTDDELRCEPAGWADADGDAESVVYAWTVDGVAAGTGPTLDGTVAFDRDQSVVCTATPDDGEELGDPLQVSVSIANTPPTLASAAIDLTAPLTDDVLGCSGSGPADADGDPVDVALQWTVDGVAAGTGPTLDGASAFSKGQVVGCTATPDDGDATGASVAAASVTVMNSPPELTSVSLGSGVSSTEADLVCVVASTDADGDTVSFSFTWTVDGSPWTGTTTTTSVAGDTVLAADTAVGELWQCEVVPSDGTDTGTAQASTATICDPAATDSTACLIDWDPTDADLTLYGEGASSRIGLGLWQGGDVNGDGIEDLLLRANQNSGTLYVLSGPVDSTTTLASTAAVESEASSSYTGQSATSVGDVNLDGYDDIVVAAPGYDSATEDQLGRAYLVLGPLSGRLSASAADATIEGSDQYDALGFAQSGADHSGDGLLDLVLTADWAGATGYSGQGEVYIFSLAGMSGLYDASADADTLIEPVASEQLRDARNIGDVDGDGQVDLGLRAGRYATSPSVVAGIYFFAGPLSAASYTTADAMAVFPASTAWLAKPTPVGDVDADGYDDVVVMDTMDDTYSTDSGAAYLIYGAASITGGPAESQGAALFGQVSQEYFPGGVVYADIDGDGNDDVIATSVYNDANAVASGCTLVFFGPLSGTHVSDDSTMRFCGDDVRETPSAALVTDDILGDGGAELVVGVSQDDTLASMAGAVHFINLP